MDVTITQNANTNTIVVNGKTIYKDSNGLWVAQIPLNSKEKQAFANYMKTQGITID